MGTKGVMVKMDMRGCAYTNTYVRMKVNEIARAHAPTPTLSHSLLPTHTHAHGERITLRTAYFFSR